MKIGSLFTGYGGLDMAVEAVTGARTAWVSDIDPGACALLAHHWPDLPNLGDIASVDWAQVEPVDVITGGFPCQDVSLAGRRAGLGPDTRTGLWSRMADAIDHLRPSLVVAENVRGVLSASAHSDVEPCPWCVGDRADGHMRALGAVLGDLADLGYDAAWCGLRAADVGAPHGRFRIFIVGWPATDPAPDAHGARREGHGPVAAQAGLADADRDRGAVVAPDGRAPLLAQSHPASVGRGEGRPEPTGLVGGSDAALGGGAAVQWGRFGPAVEQWEAMTRPAPAPTQPSTRGGPHLAPRFTEWLMGLPAGHVTDVPGLSRNAQLKLLGNGVVPAQAEAALRYLLPLTGAAAAA